MLVRLLLAVFGLAGLLSSCCEEKVIDPCDGKLPFRADIDIFEGVGDSLIRTDTICVYSFATFKAAGDYDTYQWQIGEWDSTATEPSVRLRFSEPLTITIRLIATKKASGCFENEPTIDTVYRTFTVVPVSESQIIGTYVGSFGSTPNKIDTVRLDYRIGTVDSNFGVIVLRNVQPGCQLKEDEYDLFAISRGYKFAKFDGLNRYYFGCKGPLVYVKLFNERTIDVQFEYVKDIKADGPFEYVKDTFKGVRI